MNRLTKKVDGSVVFPAELVGITLTPDNEYMNAILTRLTPYEDVIFELPKSFFNMRVPVRVGDKVYLLREDFQDEYPETETEDALKKKVQE